MLQDTEEMEAAREALIESRGIPTNAKCVCCGGHWEDGDEEDPERWVDLSKSMVRFLPSEGFVCSSCTTVVEHLPADAKPFDVMRAMWHDGHAHGARHAQAALDKSFLAEREAKDSCTRISFELHDARKQAEDTMRRLHIANIELAEERQAIHDLEQKLDDPEGLSPVARKRIAKLEGELTSAHSGIRQREARARRILDRLNELEPGVHRHF